MVTTSAADGTEQLARRVLANLVSGMAKLNDSPISAATHFDAAICELARATAWRPTDNELRAIIDDAMEHMRYFAKDSP